MSGKHPTTKRRNRKQKVKATYAKAREDAQLEGVIPTSPEGAVRNERVDPALQDEQRFPGLDRAAILAGEGWGTTEAVKRKVIEKNAEVLYERKVTWDKDGNEIVLPPDRAAIEKASRVLMTADQIHFERTHPEEAGKAKGGTTVGVAVINWNALPKDDDADPFEVAREKAERELPKPEPTNEAPAETTPDDVEQDRPV